VSALIDWFTLLFFSAGALIIWVVWLSLQTGFPAKPALNVARIAPGFEPHFSLSAMLIALVATLAWVNLVRWRSGRHLPVLWKSMAMPAGGATLCWLLIMTLWLPLLDFGRSYAPLVDRVIGMMGTSTCVHYRGLTKAQGAAFEFHGQLKLVPLQNSASIGPGATLVCPWLIVDTQSLGTQATQIDLTAWVQHATVRRPSDKNEDIVLFRRKPLS
jgi:hypothetical protein